MVLRMSRVLLAAALALLAGCIHRIPVAHLATPTRLTATFYVDQNDTRQLLPMPDEVTSAVREQLTLRNVQVTEVERAPGKTSSQRLSALVAAAAGAPLVMLVESKVVYFDQMQGRFKWTVYARITLARPDDLASATTKEFDIPVFLRFDREKEHEALVEAGPAIAERAGQLADEYLGARAEVAEPTASSTRGRPATIYFVLVDRYANGNVSNDGEADLTDPAAFHGGDLQGVIDHLDDIQRQGFDTVWLSPVWKTRHEKFFGHGAFHGYWVEDFGDVDARFGDRRLLRRLSEALHRRHMKLLLDVVLNHVSFDSPLLKTHPDWFHHKGEIKNWDDRQELQDHDVMGLPDLAQEREDVYQYLVTLSKKWIDDAQPDGFRLDAVKHISSTFWKRYNAELHAYAGRDFFLLGEDLDGDPAHLARTAREDGFDAMFDFPLYFAIRDVICDGKPLGRLAAILSLDRTYPGPSSLVTLVDNHDLPRIVTACHGDLHRAQAALNLIFALRGTPSVTYGTEAGLTGAKEPDNRAEMTFGSPVLRFAQRTELQRDCETRIVEFDSAAMEIACAGLQGGRLRVTRAGVTGLAEPSVVSSRGTRTLNIHLSAQPPLEKAELLAVGSAPELGAWDPQRGAVLHGSSLSVDVPDGAVYEFKFVKRRADRSVEWESRDDRFVFVPPGTGALNLEAAWNGS
jgi:glycosidase